MNDVAVAVVTGKHTFDIPGFQQMFSSMSNMEFYLQDLENFVADVGKYNDKYDVVLFTIFINKRLLLMSEMVL